MFIWFHNLINKDKEDYLEDSEIEDLFNKYNEMFPDYPLDDSFFEDTDEEEIVERLENAINLNEPIARGWVLK